MLVISTRRTPGRIQTGAALGRNLQRPTRGRRHRGIAGFADRLRL